MEILAILQIVLGLLLSIFSLIWMINSLQYWRLQRKILDLQLKELQKRNIPQKSTPKTTPQVNHQPIPQFSKTEEEIELENKQLHSELVHITGNYKVADELLKQKRKQYPRKTETWCLKQLISELRGESKSTDTPKKELSQPQSKPTIPKPDAQKTPSASIPKADPPLGTPLPNLKAIKYPKLAKPANNPNTKQLQKELLTMLGGNTEVANRLVARQRQINPAQTEAWYLEKVISDLKRDRRA